MNLSVIYILTNCKYKYQRIFCFDRNVKSDNISKYLLMLEAISANDISSHSLILVRKKENFIFDNNIETLTSSRLDSVNLGC